LDIVHRLDQKVVCFEVWLCTRLQVKLEVVTYPLRPDKEFSLLELKEIYGRWSVLMGGGGERERKTEHPQPRTSFLSLFRQRTISKANFPKAVMNRFSKHLKLHTHCFMNSISQEKLKRTKDMTSVQPYLMTCAAAYVLCMTTETNVNTCWAGSDKITSGEVFLSGTSLKSL
jgi:hypothetical protein